MAPPEGERLEVAIARRQVGNGATLLVFNESWQPHTTRLRFTRPANGVWRWDPRSGARDKLRDHVEAGDEISLSLEAAESILLTLR